MAKVANFQNEPKRLLDFEHSGLLNYLFGRERDKEIFPADFHSIHDLILNDLLFIEYHEVIMMTMTTMMLWMMMMMWMLMKLIP